ARPSGRDPRGAIVSEALSLSLHLLLQAVDGGTRQPDNLPYRGAVRSPGWRRLAYSKGILAMHAIAKGGLAWLLAASLAVAAQAPVPSVSDLLTRIRAVGTEGAGAVEAAAAWKELQQAGPEALPAILAAMDGA